MGYKTLNLSNNNLQLLPLRIGVFNGSISNSTSTDSNLARMMPCTSARAMAAVSKRSAKRGRLGEYFAMIKGMGFAGMKSSLSYNGGQPDGGRYSLLGTMRITFSRFTLGYWLC